MNDCEFSEFFWLSNMALDFGWGWWSVDHMRLDLIMQSWNWDVWTLGDLIQDLQVMYVRLSVWSQQPGKNKAWFMNLAGSNLVFIWNEQSVWRPPCWQTFFCSFLLLLFPAFSTPECTTSTTPGSRMRRWSSWCVAFWSYSASLQLW